MNDTFHLEPEYIGGYLSAMNLAQIESEAMKLAEADRAVLVDHLQASLGSGKSACHAEQVAEAQSRLAAHKAGELRSFDGASFVASLKESLS